jgi:hypothetical protein
MSGIFLKDEGIKFCAFQTVSFLSKSCVELVQKPSLYTDWKISTPNDNPCLSPAAHTSKSICTQLTKTSSSESRPLNANEPLDDSRGGVDVKNNNQTTEPILCEQQAAIKYRTIELVQRPSLGCTISVPTDHFFKHNRSYMSITQLRESSGSDSKGHKTTQVFTLHKTHQNIQFGLLKATC